MTAETTASAGGHHGEPVGCADVCGSPAMIGESSAVANPRRSTLVLERPETAGWPRAAGGRIRSIEAIVPLQRNDLEFRPQGGGPAALQRALRAWSGVGAAQAA
jgi:hypothetical protein